MPSAKQQAEVTAPPIAEPKTGSRCISNTRYRTLSAVQLIASGTEHCRTYCVNLSVILYISSQPVSRRTERKIAVFIRFFTARAISQYAPQSRLKVQCSAAYRRYDNEYDTIGCDIVKNRNGYIVKQKNKKPLHHRLSAGALM